MRSECRWQKVILNMSCLTDVTEMLNIVWSCSWFSVYIGYKLITACLKCRNVKYIIGSVNPVTVRAAAVFSHYLPSGECRLLLLRQTDQLYLRKRVLEVWVRHLFASPWTWNVLLCWGDDHSSSSSPAPQHVNSHSLYPVQVHCESANVQRDGEGSQEPRSSNLFPCQHPTSLLEFDVIHLRLYISSSTSFSLSFFTHPHPNPPHLFLFLSFLRLCCERRCMIYEALFLPVTEEKERERKRRQSEGERKKKGGRRMKLRVWRASPRGRRTGECEGDIHHPVTLWLKMKTGSRLRQKYDGSDHEETAVVYCYRLDTVWWLIISLVSHLIHLCAFW